MKRAIHVAIVTASTAPFAATASTKGNVMARNRFLNRSIAGLAAVAAGACGLLVATVAPAHASTTGSAIVAIAQRELNDNTRNYEIGTNCSFYGGYEFGWPACGGMPGWGGGTSDYAWCAAFARYVWQQAGVTTDLGQINGMAASFMSYGQSHGTWHARGSYIAQPGDAVVFDWNHDGTIDHVGIVTSTSGGTLYTIEGNASDRTEANSYASYASDGDIVGFSTAADVAGAPAALERIGLVNTALSVAVKEGSLGAGWVTVTTGASKVVLSGTRIGVLTSDGKVMIKDGDLGAGWVTVATGATQLAMSGTRIGVLFAGGTAAVKDGDLGGPWVTEDTDVTQLALAGTRIGVLHSNGTVGVKEGDLGGPWVSEDSDVTQLALSGSRIGVLHSNGTVAVKDGGLGAGWVSEDTDVTQLALAGTRIGVLHSDGTVAVKDGDLGAAWVTEATDVTQLALSGTRIGVLQSDGYVLVKEGDLGAGWVTESNGVVQLALSNP